MRNKEIEDKLSIVYLTLILIIFFLMVSTCSGQLIEFTKAEIYYVKSSDSSCVKIFDDGVQICYLNPLTESIHCYYFGQTDICYSEDIKIKQKYLKDVIRILNQTFVHDGGLTWYLIYSDCIYEYKIVDSIKGYFKIIIKKE